MEHQKSFENFQPPGLQDASPTSPTFDGSAGGAMTFPPNAASSAAPGSPALNPRSCVTCRRRKVRCDKHMPCSNCRRAQITCIFPAPGRAPRRPRPKDPNAPPKNSSEREMELMKRLRKLEGIVEDLSGQIDVDHGTGGGSGGGGGGGRQAFGAEDSPEATASEPGPHRDASTGSSGPDHQSPPLVGGKVNVASSDTGYGRPPRRQSDMGRGFGRLVHTDKGKSRYVSSAFWSRLTDELEQIRAESGMYDEETDESDEDETPDNSPRPLVAGDHTAFLFGYRSADVDLRKLHPAPAQIPYLWQVYEENVEPLIKILHVPTAEKMLRDVRKSMDGVSPGNEALMFSIYYAAITSLEEDEIQSNLGADKLTLLSKYRFALEQALAKANFLNTNDIVVLQAFVLFLILARRHDDTRFCWTMTGLAIRIAHGLGLHRDGTNFNLPPFEVEMRRRLWWALCTLDLRSAEELGTDLTIVERSFDTQLPTNLNDADLDPDSKEAPTPRVGASDYAVALVRCMICALARRLHTAASAMAAICPRDACSTYEEREKSLIEVYEDVEDKFTRHFIGHENAIFWLSAIIARVIMAKMSLIIYLPLLAPDSGQELPRITRDRLFVTAIEIVEYNHLLNTDDRCKQWRWLFQTYTQWHAIAYLLMEIAKRPWSATVERAWEALNGTLNTRHQIELAKMANHTAVWMPLRRLFWKARKHRESEVVRLRADPEAARLLDFEDRLHPSSARFGPVPGMEHQLVEIRERWRKTMRPNAASPEPPVRPLASDHAKAGLSLANDDGALKTATARSTNVGGDDPSTAPLPAVDFTATFTDPNPVIPVDLWTYVFNGDVDQILGAASTNNPVSGSTPSRSRPVGSSMGSQLAGAGTGTTASTASADALSSLRREALLFKARPTAPQAPTLSAVGKDNNPPPFMWSDPFTVMNTKFDDIPMGEGDVNMDVEDEFNWQSWQESMKGFEMDTGGAPTNAAW